MLAAMELLRIFMLVPLLSNVTYSRRFVVIFNALICGMILRLIHAGPSTNLYNIGGDPLTQLIYF